MQKHFGESEAGKSAVKDLMSALEKQDTKGMFDNIPEFKNGGWKDLDKWGKSNAGDLWKMKPPDLGGTKSTPPKVNSGSSGGLVQSVAAGSSGERRLGWRRRRPRRWRRRPWRSSPRSPGRSSSRCLLFRKWKVHQAEQSRGDPPVSRTASTSTPSGRANNSSTRSTTCRSTRSAKQPRPWNHRVIADQIAEIAAGPCRAGRSARGTVRTGPIRPSGRGPDDQ